MGYVTGVSNPLSITIPYPNGVSNLSDGYQRVWKLLRYHRGDVDELDVSRTSDGFSIENDKYSAFALVYQDIKIDGDENSETNNSEAEIPGTKTDETKIPETKTDETEIPETKNNEIEVPDAKTDEVDVPQTGDNIMIWIYMLIVSIISFNALVIVGKRKKI